MISRRQLASVIGGGVVAAVEVKAAGTRKKEPTLAPIYEAIFNWKGKHKLIIPISLSGYPTLTYAKVLKLYQVFEAYGKPGIFGANAPDWSYERGPKDQWLFTEIHLRPLSV